MTDSTDDPASPGRGSFRLHRNPWIWAFLLGIVTLTLLRPVLRRVPDPPPVEGRLPAFELSTSGGEPFGLDDLSGSVWIAGFVGGEGAPNCRGLVDSMLTIGDKLDRNGIGEVRFLGLDLAPEGGRDRLAERARERGVDATRFVLLTGDPGALGPLAAGLVGAAGERVRGAVSSTGVPYNCRLTLLDAVGGIRGSYRDDTSGLEEIYYRAQHVLKAGG